jgi:hypothetical protein
VSRFFSEFYFLLRLLCFWNLFFLVLNFTFFCSVFDKWFFTRKIWIFKIFALFLDFLIQFQNYSWYNLWYFIKFLFRNFYLLCNFLFAFLSLSLLNFSIYLANNSVIKDMRIWVCLLKIKRTRLIGFKYIWIKLRIICFYILVKLTNFKSWWIVRCWINIGKKCTQWIQNLTTYRITILERVWFRFWTFINYPFAFNFSNYFFSRAQNIFCGFT